MVASRAMRLRDDRCVSRIQSRRQTIAPAHGLMLCDSILMVIVTSLVSLGGETRKRVRSMLAVAGNARLGQL